MVGGTDFGGRHEFWCTRLGKFYKLYWPSTAYQPSRMLKADLKTRKAID